MLQQDPSSKRSGPRASFHMHLCSLYGFWYIVSGYCGNKLEFDDEEDLVAEVADWMKWLTHTDHM